MATLLSRRSFVVGTTGLAVFVRLPALGDVGGAESASRRGLIVSACMANWEDNKGDCSGFVRSVVAALNVGVTLTGGANSICDQIEKDPWLAIGTGERAAEVAGLSAGEGKLVVAGLRATGNGHVAIVVDYRNAFDTYEPVDRNKAVAFWGKLHSVGMEYARITRSWSAEDLKKVFYACVPVP